MSGPQRWGGAFFFLYRPFHTCVQQLVASRLSFPPKLLVVAPKTQRATCLAHNKSDPSGMAGTKPQWWGLQVQKKPPPRLSRPRLCCRLPT